MWLDLPRRFLGIDVDAFVVIPNHVHGIVVLGTDPESGGQGETPPWGEGAMNRAPTNMAASGQEDVRNVADTHHRVGARFIAPSPSTPTSRFLKRSTQTPGQGPGLGEVVRAFKAVTARQVRLATLQSFSWHRDYYEHIIRNARELARARAYIAANPSRWTDDAENPIRSA